MRATAAALTAALLGAVFGGCARHSRPVAPKREMSAAERNFEAVWQASLDVLRKYNFTIERQDRRAGVITTRAITGKHYFEFWRGDAVTAFDLAENTIQTMYRTATVTVWAKEDKPGAYEAGVTIDLVRSNQKSVQVSSTSEAYSIFALPGGRGAYLTTSETDEAAGQRDTADSNDPSTARPPEGRVPLGRDTRLEARIAREIAATASKYLAKGR